VARSRPGLVDRYLDRLAAAGVVRAEGRQVMGLFPGTRWVVVDTARQAQVRARLDAIASGSVAPGRLDSEQAAFAGLAGAIGLSALIYPGFAGAAARKNLKKAATRDRSESPAAGAVADAAAAMRIVEDEYGGRAGASVDQLDGLTAELPDGSWFNLRPSNTEPLLRLNVEATDERTMEGLRDEVLALVRR